MKYVPNLFPKIPSQYRIAVIGEAPGENEERTGVPFVGYSGKRLDLFLAKAGTSRDACFIGNVCQVRPANNHIWHFQWDGPEIQSGLAQLEKDIATFNPHLCILLGNIPLKAARDPHRIHPLTRGFSYPISNWRGSFFVAQEGPLAGRKCIATYHPSATFEQQHLLPFFKLDLKKAVPEGRSPELVLPQREYKVHTDPKEALAAIRRYQSERKLVSADIEGGIRIFKSIGLSNHPMFADVIPFVAVDGSFWWSAEDELVLLLALADLMEDPLVPKCFQAGLYDRFVLHWSLGIRTVNVTDDTMLKHWELNSDFAADDDRKKGKRGMNLALQASIYTKEPYWKQEIKSPDNLTFFRYNGKDAAVTLEICQYLDHCLVAQCSKDHYRFNMELTAPFLYMELRGIAYNETLARQRRQELQRQLHIAQAKLNALAGLTLPWDKGPAAIIDKAAELMLTVKRDRAYKKYIVDWDRFQTLMAQPNPDLATIGELESLCEAGLNVSASGQLATFLYDILGLKVKYSEVRGQDPSITTDYEALLKLSNETKEQPLQHEVIQLILEIRALETRQRMLGIQADFDSRIRCGYNPVGSNTGRTTCYESPTGSGYNLQTIPNYTNPAEAPGGILGDRDCFSADVDHWFFQCDLKGADGWTVAAYCAMLGDDTMLQDYLANLKPYLILCCKVRGYHADFGDRESLRMYCKQIEKDAWDAFASKRVQHGGAYCEGDLTISRNIHKDSEGKLYISPAECGKLKAFYMQRYPGIQRYHNYIAGLLNQRPVLVAASGQIRQFTGRPDELLPQAVAFEPQANTTYALNKAAHRLWHDPENRFETLECVQPSKIYNDHLERLHMVARQCKLHVEPLHQVHDALCGQFPKARTEWSISKLKSYFAHPIKIAGRMITIPFDGGYGPSWGNLKEGSI